MHISAGLSLYVPLVHGVHAPEFVDAAGATLPESHNLHVVAPSSAYFPTPHVSQVSALTASGVLLDLPAAHFLHVVPSKYLPALHPLHSVAATAGKENFPAAQGWQAPSLLLPATPLALPSVQSVQVSMFEASIVALHFPAAHDVQVSMFGAPAVALHFPAAHDVHASLCVVLPVVPLPCQPAGHSLHALRPVSSANL